jgi:hypothetical protein
MTLLLAELRVTPDARGRQLAPTGFVADKLWSEANAEKHKKSDTNTHIYPRRKFSCIIGHNYLLVNP